MKSVRNIFALLFSLACADLLSAQTGSPVALPQILPSSPEPTAFIKAGVGNINRSTGGASAGIPLYTIQLKDYQFPVSLSYYTQGLKADEASSRVGYGWILNATGMITRSVKGKPDEYAQRINNLPTNYTDNNSTNLSYFTDAASSTVGGDPQPDEFQFSVNGYSGKFILDNNYVPRITSTSNVRITVAIQVTPGSTSGGIGLINLITPDGVKYQFGSAYEKTTDVNIFQFSPYKLVTKTAFFLDKIELPTGETIDFSYNSINTRVITGNTQTLQKGRLAGSSACEDCSSRNSYTTQVDRVEYSTRYLTQITASNGLEINFTYEPRTDLSYDNRLKTVNVESVKNYSFEYFDVAGNSSQITGRFFLTKVKETKTDPITLIAENHEYTLTYNNLSDVPLPITFRQDYLGFYNASNTNCFIPTFTNSNNEIDFSFREPNHTYSKYGTLSSIAYPTGGKEEFFYENNTRAERVKRNTMTTYDLEGNGGGSSGSYSPITYTKDNITVPRNQTVTMTASTADAVLDDGYSADPSHHTATVSLYEGTTLIASRSVMGYENTSATFDLFTGHTYRMTLKVERYRERGYATIWYDGSDHDIFDTLNIAFPGHRVNKILLTDPLAGKTVSKYFTYGSLETPQFSSGADYYRVDYHSITKLRTYCGQLGDLRTDCLLDIYSSSSTNAVYNCAGSGSVIYYKNVIESDDPQFIHGGTEYTFYDNDNGSNHQALIDESIIPYTSAGQYPTLSGVVSRIRTFNAQKEVLEEENHEYETLIDMANTTPSIYARKRYDPWPGYPDWYEAFDAVKTTYSSWWIRLKKTTNITTVANVPLTKQVTYTYGTTQNILPVSTLTKNSKSEDVLTEMKYPTESLTNVNADPVFSSAAYLAMINRNIISPVVQQSNYKGGILQQQTRTLYRDWFSDSKILLPEFIQTKESPAATLHNSIVFTGYNVKGNPLSLNKANNIGLVYIWDDLHGLPICEVRNANANQVAYTGFEPDTQTEGNWAITSGSTSSLAAFTGSLGFTGTLSKTITVSGTYNVRLWTNSTVTVNGGTGSLVRTADGWNYYQWTLTNPSSITVSGTNIDELSLCPKEASLVSYTYFPFVGVGSVSDINGNVSYYEYDNYNRLACIRDVHKNILKQIRYRYQVPTTTEAIWQSTGTTRCKPCPANNTYFTNIQQHEEKNINTESSTYNATHWVDDGASSNCVVIADWQNTGSVSCETSNGQNTGYQLFIQKDMNPCSPTYNTNRTNSVYNPTACPIPCNSGNCGGNDKKCVNGVCETGTRINTSSVYMKNAQQVWVWRCTYHYRWSDNSVSANYTEDNSTSCPLGGEV
jgi:hypothetical protein